MFTKVIEFVAEAVKVVGNAVVDVLSDLFQAAGSAIGDIFSANPLLWMVVGGVGLFWLFGGDDKKDESSIGQYRDAIRSTRGSLGNVESSLNA